MAGPVFDPGNMLRLDLPGNRVRFERRATRERDRLEPDPDLSRVVPFPPAITVVRPADLLIARFSFTNLIRDDAGGVRRLARRDRSRPGYLIVDLQPQHIVEQAFPQKAPQPPTPGEPDLAQRRQPAPAGSPPANAPVDVPADPPGPNPTPAAPPVLARLAAHSRLVFRIDGDGTVDFTLAGLLAACSFLPLSVAPHAAGPRMRSERFIDMVTATDLSAAMRNTPVTRIAAMARTLGAARMLESRLGVDAATASSGTLSVFRDLGLELRPGIGIGFPGLLQNRPLPRPPERTETAIELPWRLQLSPGSDGAFAHSTDPVDHDGRIELWHTRLATRRVDGKQVLADESGHGSVRAIWARDFGPRDQHRFPFAADGDTAPSSADGTGDVPVWTKSLNSRDRMMLVHETSNWTLSRQAHRWDPSSTDVERMLLTSLGGWLRSQLDVPTLPDGKLTLQQWKHRATMGRDHEVKVVYAGHLCPFGHKASLVKVTERKFDPAHPDVAYLYQRFFILVRQPVKTYPAAPTFTEQRTYTATKGDVKDPDLVNPFGSVSILTEITPDLDWTPSLVKPGGFVFVPQVDGAPFAFRLLAQDRDGNTVEWTGPLMFVERDHNTPPLTANWEGGAGAVAVDRVSRVYWDLPEQLRRQPLGGQKVSYAPSVGPNNTPLDTIYATDAMFWDAAITPGTLALNQDEPRFTPLLRSATVVSPALSALAGNAGPISVSYPKHYAAKGFSNNAAHVFLQVNSPTTVDFAGQGNRSGGFVTPNLKVTAFSGSTGPIGGDLGRAETGNTTPADFFAGIEAKLFGLVSLPELLAAVGLTPDRLPSFIGRSVNRVTAFLGDLERVRDIATRTATRFAAEPLIQPLVTALNTVSARAGAVRDAVADLVGQPPTPPDLPAMLATLADAIGTAADAVTAAAAFPATLRNEASGVLRRVGEHLEDATDLLDVIRQFARGAGLPETVTATLDWRTEFGRWPSTPGVPQGIFQPLQPGKSVHAARCTLDLSVEVQAPTRPGKEPTALVACSLSPFQLRLLGDDPFISLQIDTMEFLLAPGRKPDVNVVLHDGNGVVFGGPLSFVETLRKIIPFDGFSDPPYLDVDAQGIKAGFDLAVPTIAVGIFSLANIAFGAQLRVPFIDDGLDFTFNFCTRENPFRLTVWLFGGGGFFAITVTPEECRMLEAAFEFGAAVALNFGVASGSIECMAGVYFRLEKNNSQLTGYFRLRGEVDVLGLISASIELYLELTYKPAPTDKIDGKRTSKAIGRATLTIEVSIFFFSFSVEISCEKEFNGSDQDPTFAQIMGPPAGGGTRPWDEYCEAFA